jgi:hypothetical protein
VHVYRMTDTGDEACTYIGWLTYVVVSAHSV